MPWLHRTTGDHTVGRVEIDSLALHRSEADPDDLVPCCRRPFRSTVVIALIAGWLAGAFAGAAPAQEPPTYGQAIFGRGLDAEITYGDPGGAGAVSADRLEPRPEPQAFSIPNRSLDWAAWLVEIIPYLILIVIAALIWKYGASIRLARRRTPDAGQRTSSADAPAAPSEMTPDVERTPVGIEQIARLSDRDRALALLLNHVLEQLLGAHQSHFRHSQTVREAVRALPPGTPAVPELLDLAGCVERVRFGGQTVSEPVFQRLLESGRALLRHAPPAGRT